MTNTIVLHANGTADLVSTEQNGTGIWIFLHEKGSRRPTCEQGKNNITELEFHSGLRRRYAWNPETSSILKEV